MKYKSNKLNFVLYKNGSDGTVKSNTPPSDTTKMWLDTSVTPNILKYYNGSKWVMANDQTREIEANKNLINETKALLNVTKQEINASLTEKENDLLKRIADLTLELEKITLEVASIYTKSSITKGEEIESWVVQETPTLMNYPTFTDFFIWNKCSDTLYCDDDLTCGTNNYSAHDNEVAHNESNQKYYLFTRDSGGEYYWKELSDEEYKAMSNYYSSVIVEKEKVRIENLFNENVGYAEVSHDGLRASQVYCC